MTHLNDKESIGSGIVGFVVFLLKSLYSHIDGWAILQSVICAIIAYLAVRLIKKIFPEKKVEK